MDPVGELADVAHRHGAWLHVDGAIGLWTAAARPSPAAGLEQADSWSTDAHKWLNVPYDCGITICRHPDAHRAAMTVTASYLLQAAPGTDRDPVDWNPEFSRRARAVPVYAAIASLGRSGIVDIVRAAARTPGGLPSTFARHPNVVVLNEVVYTDNSYDAIAMGVEQTIFSYGGDLGDYATYKVNGIVNSKQAIEGLEVYHELYKFAPPVGAKRSSSRITRPSLRAWRR